MQTQTNNIFDQYKELKERLGVLIVPWKFGENDNGKITKQESYSSQHYTALKEVDGYSAGNPFLHETEYYKVIDQEQFGVRLPNRNYIENWYKDDYILLLGDCDFLKGDVPQDEKDRANKITIALAPKESALQRKNGLPEQVHTFCWVHKDILKHLSGVQFKIPLGEPRETSEGEKKRSVFELFFAGKFLRCGKDYQGDLDFYNLPKMSSEEFLDLVNQWEKWGMNRENIHRNIEGAKTQNEYVQNIDGSEVVQSGNYEDSLHIEKIIKKIFNGRVKGYDQGRALLQYIKAYDHKVGKDSSPLLMKYLVKISSDPNGLLRGYLKTKFSRKHRNAINELFESEILNTTKENTYSLRNGEYLSDRKNIINAALNYGWWTLLEAPMGTGKTTMLIENFKPDEKHIKIIALPRNLLKGEVYNKALKKGIKVEIVGGAGNKSFKNIELDKSTLYICSYEALLYLNEILRPTDDYKGTFEIIIDEVHLWVTEQRFRKKILDLFSILHQNPVIRRILLVTATPQDLPKIWDTHIKIEAEARIKANVAFPLPSEGYKTVRDNEIISLIKEELKISREEGGHFIYVTDTKTSLITSNFSNDELKLYTKDTVGEIGDYLTNGELPEDPFAITNLIGAGNNFMTEKPVRIIYRPQTLYSSSIEQQAGRFRNSKNINMTVIIPTPAENYRNKDSYEYIQRVLDDINNPNLRTFAIHNVLNSDYLPSLELVGSRFELRREVFDMYVASRSTWKSTLKKVIEDLKERNSDWTFKETTAEPTLEKVKRGNLKKYLRKELNTDEKYKVFLIYCEARRNDRDVKILLEKHKWLSCIITGIKDKDRTALNNLFRKLRVSKDNTENFFEKYFLDKEKYSPSLQLTEIEIDKIQKALIIEEPFVDSRRLVKVQKKLEEVLGRIFTYGYRDKNTETAKCVLKEAGLKPYRDRGDNTVTIDMIVEKSEVDKINKAKRDEHKLLKKKLKGNYKSLKEIPNDKLPKLALETISSLRDKRRKELLNKDSVSLKSTLSKKSFKLLRFSPLTLPNREELLSKRIPSKVLPTKDGWFISF